MTTLFIDPKRSMCEFCRVNKGDSLYVTGRLQVQVRLVKGPDKGKIVTSNLGPDWPACSECAECIEKEDLQGLTNRALKRPYASEADRGVLGSIMKTFFDLKKEFEDFQKGQNG